MVLSIVALLLATCGGGANDVAGAARAWFEAFTRFDFERMGELTCEQEKDSLVQGLDAFTGGEVDLSGFAALFQFDISGLEFEESDVGDTSATVHIAGLMKITIFGQSEEDEVNIDLPMLNEGGTWKVCTGELPDGTSSEPESAGDTDIPEPEFVATDEIRFEVVGQDEDKVIDAVAFQDVSLRDQIALGFVEADPFSRYSITLYMPRDITPGTHNMDAYERNIAAESVSALIFIGAWFYYADGGTLVIDSYDGATIGGSFEFSAGREDDAALSITVTGEFHDIELMVATEEPVDEPTPTAEPAAVLTVPEELASMVAESPEADAPEGFLWRIGGEGGVGDNQFAFLDGMDTDAAGRVYVTDNTRGIVVLDVEGNILGLIESPGMSNPTDVKIGPDGNVVVAAWGSSQIYVFKPNGEFVIRFGAEGIGEARFSRFGPQAIAVAPNGDIYVLDDNEDEGGRGFTHVQIFNSGGEYLDRFEITESFFSARTMDFSPDGNLYVLSYLGGRMLQFDTEGNLLATVAEEALEDFGAQRVNIDDAGNFYISTWSPQGVIMLDPDFNLVAQFGIEVPREEAEDGLVQGGLVHTTGVAALRDGSRVFVADVADFVYLNALEFDR